MSHFGTHWLDAVAVAIASQFRRVAFLTGILLASIVWLGGPTPAAAQSTCDVDGANGTAAGASASGAFSFACGPAALAWAPVQQRLESPRAQPRALPASPASAPRPTDL